MKTETLVVLGVAAFLFWQMQQKSAAPAASAAPPPPPQGTDWGRVVSGVSDIVKTVGDWFIPNETRPPSAPV
jgi:hypothetical protein